MGDKGNRDACDQNERRISESVYTRSCLYGFWRKIGHASRKPFMKIKLQGKCFRGNVAEEQVKNQRKKKGGGGAATERKKVVPTKYRIKNFESTDDGGTGEIGIATRGNGNESRAEFDLETERSVMESVTRDSGARMGEFESVNSSDLHTIQLEDSTAGSSS